MRSATRSTQLASSPRRTPIRGGWLRRGVTVCVLALVLLAPAFAQPPAQPMARVAAATPATEQQKIDYLIASVAALKGASFIRNGSAYDARHAAAHMRLKRRFAGDRVKTAQDFITCCATGSSMSGLPYTIRFADGHTLESAIYLRRLLATYRPGVGDAAH